MGSCDYVGGGLYGGGCGSDNDEGGGIPILQKVLLV